MRRFLATTRHAFLIIPFVSYLGIGRMCFRCRRDLVSRWPLPARHRSAFVSSLDGSVGQISPDKNVNFHDATAAFTVSPEPGVSSCGADLPEDSALYAICVPRIRSGAGQAHRFALRLPSDGPSRFRPCLRPALVQISKRTFAGFTCRGLAPQKLTPMPGVPQSAPADVGKAARLNFDAGAREPQNSCHHRYTEGIIYMPWTSNSIPKRGD
jgi:hypothetical protein